MKFKRITIQNFISIKSASLDLDSQGLVLIKGMNKDNPSARSNGAGKSSLIEAIVFAIYGRTLRGIKGDSVVNNVSKKNMKIFLDLIDDDGTEYRIARYRKHSVNKNRSLLYQNGKDITPKSEADFNDVVANLLQADYLTFTSSLLYSAESFKFTSATDAEMKTTFDMMLGLDVFNKCLEITKSRKKDIDYKVENQYRTIETIKDRLSELDSQIKDASESQKTYEEEQKAKIKEKKSHLKSEQEELKAQELEYSNLEKSFKKAQKVVDKKSEALKEFEDNLEMIGELKDLIRENQFDIKSCNKEIKLTEEDIEALDRKIKRQEKEHEEFLATIKKHKIAKKELDKQIGQPCPTCGKPLTEDNIEPARQEYDRKISQCEKSIEEILDFINEYKDEKISSQDKLQNLNNSLSILDEELQNNQELLEKSQEIIDDAQKLEEELEEAKDNLSSIKTDCKLSEQQVATLKKNIVRIKKEVEELQETKNPYEDIIKKHKESQHKQSENIREIEKEISELADEKECLDFWAQAYSNQGIKSFILDDITPFLNRRVNKYLKKLASNHIEVKFSAQTQLKTGEMREKFSIEILNEDGGSEYIANSSGEKRRIDLAVNLALQDLVASRSSKRINIAIFDECFDALDDIGTEQVIQLLQELSEEKSSIFVISHNEHLKAYFSNSITMVKEKGCSRLLEQSEDIEEE